MRIDEIAGTQRVSSIGQVVKELQIARMVKRGVMIYVDGAPTLFIDGLPDTFPFYAYWAKLRGMWEIVDRDNDDDWSTLTRYVTRAMENGYNLRMATLPRNFMKKFSSRHGGGPRWTALKFRLAPGKMIRVYMDGRETFRIQKRKRPSSGSYSNWFGLYQELSPNKMDVYQMSTALDAGHRWECEMGSDAGTMLRYIEAYAALNHVASVTYGRPERPHYEPLSPEEIATFRHEVGRIDDEG